MQRQPIDVALSVFAFSVISELLCIRVLRGALAEWLHHPHRLFLFPSLIVVNVLNAATAMYFSSRAVRAELRLRINEIRQRQIGVHLNQHLRNALTVVQHAAFLTNDGQTIQLCDDAVKRIITVLVSAESGLPSC